MLIERRTLPVNMPKALNGTEPRSDLKVKPSLFEALPGEIRNQIFELCIHNALKPIKVARWSTTQPPAKGMEISILPQWHGPVRMRMSGIGPLSLLFVNKRINHDIGSLIYSKVDNLRLGGYILQHPNEDPNLKWQLLHPLLMNPHISRFTKNIKLKLPSTRDDLHRRNCSLRGFSITGFKNQIPERTLKPAAIMSVIPGLVECLGKFESLATLEITITAEMTSPPDFEPLLPLYDICGKCTNVVFIDPIEYFGINFYSTWWQWTERWDLAWKDCLIRNGRA